MEAQKQTDAVTDPAPLKMSDEEYMKLLEDPMEEPKESCDAYCKCDMPMFVKTVPATEVAHQAVDEAKTIRSLQKLNIESSMIDKVVETIKLEKTAN